MTDHSIMEVSPEKGEAAEPPMLSASWPDGRRIEVWADGRATGVDDSCIIVNRAPLIIVEKRTPSCSK